MKQIILVLAAFMLVFTGCKKEDKKRSSSEILMSHTWRVSNVFIDDVPEAIDDCEKDNTVKFLASSVYVTDEGATKCDPADPQSETGTWNLNGSLLTITISGSTYDYTLTSVNDSQFEARLTFFGSVFRIIFKPI